MEEKKDILWRVYLVYFLLGVFGVAIVGKVALIQFVEGEKWVGKAESLTTVYKNIDAVRGNIYAADGSLLATSVPIYEVRFDPNSEALTDEVWEDNIDSLSVCLAELFMDKTPVAYKRDLVNAREAGKRYHLIKRNVKYTYLKKMREFPLFVRGRYKGGFIYLQQNKRSRPFRLLAARTIGYDREGVKPVGLEGAYRNELKGVSGKRLMQKIAGGVWMPINDENEIEPQDGSDLHTTFDINLQDVAESALLEQLVKHDAAHGCVVLMEVATGDIKAISNLSRGESGQYYENYNFAIGASTEPGSTFKLASLVAAIEDGLVDITDSVDTKDGKFQFYDRTMRDSKRGGHGKVTVKRAFEVSSNVGVSRIINDVYAKDPQKFIDRLCKMGLNKKTGIEIAGEGVPMIKNINDKHWSGVTLPWMSIGYEVSLTPLQILTFYNAIANNGKMVKPKMVDAISKRGTVVKQFKTEVLNESICSESTIAKVKEMLEGVVSDGTATNLQNSHYRIAGKTGTTQIFNDKYGYKYDSKVSHQASFCGYFPAENPQYSCIVVVNAPSNHVYYGNLVAGPIFKEISDKVYARSIDIHEEIDDINHVAKTRFPVSKNGSQEDLVKVFRTLDLQADLQQVENKWALTRTGDDKVDVLVRRVQKGLVPNVSGMVLNDAVYLLENSGLVVEFTGKGVVKSQSIKAGVRVNSGQKITLELS